MIVQVRILTETLLKGMLELGIKLTEEQTGQFVRYYGLLVETNKHLNLTTITGEREVAAKHFIDSVTCFQAGCFQDFGDLLDVGTGAGFPGIPIKICRPEIKITLVETLKKRVKFLNEVIEALNLKSIRAIHIRAEDLARTMGFKEKYERVVARAVAGMPVLAEYCLPPLKVGGFFLAMKGPGVEKELLAAEKAIAIMGGKIDQILKIRLPVVGDKRTLVVIRKLEPTPEKYPRRAGIPLKKPL